MRKFFVASVLVLLAGCATLSPASRIEQRLVDLGLSKQRAGCVTGELRERLDRSDLNDIANFLDDIHAAGSAGNVIARLASINNTRAAAAVAASAITCALG